ncbi:MAG: ECF-type sigma factor [Isosphaeraceae bacterium]
MNDVTRILSAIEQGDRQAAEELLPLVYDELRRLAARRLAREKPGQTLQATALVHEAYLGLVGTGGERGWQGRAHFFAAAAEAMRLILINRARDEGRWGHLSIPGRAGQDGSGSQPAGASRERRHVRGHSCYRRLSDVDIEPEWPLPGAASADHSRAVCGGAHGCDVGQDHDARLVLEPDGALTLRPASPLSHRCRDQGNNMQTCAVIDV